MNKLNKTLFLSSMVGTIITMIYGHVLIVSSGAWFIPNKEKYNILTRWVSDFAAYPGEGLWIKGSIGLFCVALSIWMLARVRSMNGESKKEHLLWGVNVVLWIGLVGGLLLVVLFDMSPPQFINKEPSFFGKIIGAKSWIQEVPRDDLDYKIQWHHQIGFQIFIWSFLLLLINSIIEKFYRRISDAARVDIIVLLLSVVFMAWLFAFHKMLAGIPQRALLMLIFYWVWKEGARQPRPTNTFTATQV